MIDGKNGAGKTTFIKLLWGFYRPESGNIYLNGINIDKINRYGRKVDVETEISYHHQRPENKSVGRATGKNDGSGFYQLCSIRAGQTFSGYIYANKHQAEVILDALERAGEIRMGYGRSCRAGPGCQRLRLHHQRTSMGIHRTGEHVMLRNPPHTGRNRQKFPHRRSDEIE